MGGWQCSVSVWNGAQYIRAYRARKPYRVGSNSIAVTFNIKGGEEEKKGMEWMESWRIYRCTCSHRLTARFIRRYRSSRGAGTSPLSPTPSAHTHNFFSFFFLFFPFLGIIIMILLYIWNVFFPLLLYVILSLVLHDRSGTWPGQAVAQGSE